MFMGRHTYLPSGYIKRNQAPVVQKVDSAIHQINLYPVDSAIIGFPNTYPPDDDLSNGQCYPTFEQPGPDVILALLFYTIAYPFLSGKRQSTYLWLIPIRSCKWKQCILKPLFHAHYNHNNFFCVLLKMKLMY